jgi:hypothetical protein
MEITYIEKTIQFPNLTARVYIPELSAEERARRMKLIHKAAAELLKGVTNE